MTFLDQLSRTVRGRSRAVARPLVLAGVAALSLAPLAIAAPAGAAAGARPPDITLFGGVAKFRVGGHAWAMSVFVTPSFGGSASISISASHEFDDWNFVSIPKSDLTANVRTGAAAFNAHNALAPVAFAKLRFFPSSRHKVSCRSGSETFFDGTLSGSITLVANHKGLKFHSAHVVFRNSSLDVDRQCMQKGSPECFPGFWNTVAPRTSASGDSSGLPGQRRFSISVDKTVALSAPKLASASYSVSGTASKPVFNSKTKRLSVKALSVVKGSAVLTASFPPTVRNSRCAIGRRQFKERDASYSGSYTSPSGFSARSIAAGLLKVGRHGSAFFDITTFKRA